MSARRLAGAPVARQVEAEAAQDVARLRQDTGIAPRLDVVLVGDDPASRVYVEKKTQAARRVGIREATHRLPRDVDPAEVARLIGRLNDEPDVHGILLQLPLPAPLDKGPLLDRIRPEKDVDCFHPHNLGLMLIGRAPMPSPTAQGVLEILDHAQVPLGGADVVVVNHSTLIGKPLAALLMNRDATVTICHKATRDLARHTRQADVLISGTGVAGLITSDHVKRGAIVVDVGFARTPDGRLTGDVDQDGVAAVAGAVTPVPGGVGPVTVAMLLKNVVAAFRLQQERAEAVA